MRKSFKIQHVSNNDVQNPALPPLRRKWAIWYNINVSMIRDTSLGAGRTKTIAFVSDSVLPTEISDLLKHVTTYAQERRSCTIRFILEDLLAQPSIFDGCDGILADACMPATIDILKASGLPVVLTSLLDGANLPCVEFSPEMNGRMAAEWFLHRRFTNFAFCGLSRYSFYERIEKAFAATVRNAGFDCAPYDREKMSVEAIRANPASVQAYLDEWIPTLPRRTAVFCIHDRRAALVIESCLRIGRAVPDDIAVMGRHNDIIVCACAPRAITSIDPNYRLQTYTALQLLEEIIDNPELAKEKKCIFIPPLGVIERESTNVYPVDPPWLAKALSLIDDNLDRHIALEDLAQAAGISQSALQKAIHKTFGMSVNKYILSVKMREAKRLIDHGGYSVKELAARTGFSTPSYFTRAYTAFYGLPPSQDSLSAGRSRGNMV